MPVFTHHRNRLLAVALPVALTAVALSASSASAATVNGVAKAPNGLTVRNGPGTGFNDVGTMAYNQSATVNCYVLGTDVDGDSWWDEVYLGDGPVTYVSDYWLDTGGNITTQNVPDCQGEQDGNTPGIAEKSGGLPLYTDAGFTPAGGSVAYGATVLVVCYESGVNVDGDDLWDDVWANGQNLGLVSDYWLYTGADVTKQSEPCGA